MNLRQLHYFVAVAEELHFGRAAQRVSISQPPLSQQILALEAELGVQLFVRTKRSVELSSVGRQWLPEVRRLLADAAGLADKARQLGRGEVGELNLAFISSAGYGELPALFRCFRKIHPHIRTNLREATSNVQIDALLRKEIDVGIVFATQSVDFPEPLIYRTLRREHLIAVIPEEWLKSKRCRLKHGKIDFATVSQEPLIIFPRQSAPSFYDCIVDYYATQGNLPIFGQEAIQMQTIISLVSAGIGIALVPESLRNLQRTGVAYCELSPSPPIIESGLLWRKDLISPALEGLLAVAWQDRNL
jgi:DNA-binding transcriptional LysR family regulator